VGKSGKLGRGTLLFAADILLLAMGWLSALYSYPRLPARMPLWLNFLGQDVLTTNKSPAFFIYPLAQTLFAVAFWLLSKIEYSRKALAEKRLGREFCGLVLIFFNLIFIHIQTSLILLAHGKSLGINEFYFGLLLAVILMLIPYFRIRRKLPSMG
jgi:uncharacterized membrane protein